MIEGILNVCMITSKFFFHSDRGKGRKLTLYDTETDSSCRVLFADYFCTNRR